MDSCRPTAHASTTPKHVIPTERLRRGWRDLLFRPSLGVTVGSTCLLMLLASACSPATNAPGRTDATGALLPDTATIDGVLTMHQGADAFVRAPQYVVAESAEVVFDDGDNPTFDLTYARSMLVLPDGRGFASTGRHPARLMLFAADGRPERIVARNGEGPGEVISPFHPTLVGGDTVMLFDGPLIEWYTPGGFARSVPMTRDSTTWCHGVLAVLSGPRLLTSDGPCPSLTRANVPDTARRPLMHLVTSDLDRSAVTPVASVLGMERVMFESRYRGRIDRSAIPLRYGRRTAMVGWGDAVAVATGEAGYVIDRFARNGQPPSRVVVDVSRRAVTADMRQLLIDRELAGLEGPSTERMVDVEESRRQAREQPFADSLPPYAELLAGTDGLLWVIDYATLADTAVTVTAFRSDGAIVKRLTIPGLFWPIWFGEDRVMLREVDADGVVRFAVYRIVAEPATP